MEIQALLIPAVVLGTGLAIDVSIATVARYRDTSLSFFNWTLPIAAYHVAFQAIGFLVFWKFLKEFPSLASLVGAAGFMLVALLVYEILCKVIGTEPTLSISQGLARVLGIKETDSRRIIIQIAVSLDALVSGPATSMLAETMSWRISDALIVFLIAGVVVAIITECALVISRMLSRVKFSSIEILTYWFVIGTFLEVSVIGGFGILSLWAGFSNDANLYTSIGIASFLLSYFFISHWLPIYTNEYDEAKQMFETEA